MPPVEEVAPPTLGGVGLAVLVTGTFLPWLQSGSHDRNSYQAGGAVRRLLGTTGLIDGLLSLWPLVGVACAAAVALYLVRLRTVAAVITFVCAVGAGAAAVAALATTATSFAEVKIIGPLMTLIGATLAVLAVLLRALVAAADPRRAP